MDPLFFLTHTHTLESSKKTQIQKRAATEINITEHQTEIIKEYMDHENVFEL